MLDAFVLGSPRMSLERYDIGEMKITNFNIFENIQDRLEMRKNVLKKELTA